MEFRKFKNMDITSSLKEALSEDEKILFESYAHELVDSIIYGFDSYGVGVKYLPDAFNIFRGKDTDNIFIEFGLRFYFVFDSDSDVKAYDKDVLRRFIKQEVSSFIKSHDYPILGKCLSDITSLGCWHYYDEDEEPGNEEYWEIWMDIREINKGVVSLGKTIDEVAKNLGKAKPVTEGSLFVIKYPKEVIDEIKIPAQYELRNLTYTGNFKYWDQFNPITINKLPNYKYWYSTSNPLYAAVNMVGIYKNNPDIVLVWRYHDKNKVAYLMNKSEYDSVTKTLEEYFEDLEIKNRN